MKPETLVANVHVYSKDCWSLPCFFHPLFDHTKSSTFKDLGTTYGDQPTVNADVSGKVVQDTVSLKGDDNVAVENYKFGLTTVVGGNEMVSDDVSGIFGLGYSSPVSSTMNGISLLTAAKLPTNSFSLYLKGLNRKSYMQIGSMDLDSHYAIRTHNVVDKTFINLNLTHVGTPGNMVNSTKYYATLVSGYSGICGQNALLRNIVGATLVAHDCSNVDALPSFTIGIDGFDYTLTGRDYVVEINGRCDTPFLLSDIPAPLDKYLFIGSQFLKKFAPHIDMDNDTVTFQQEKATQSEEVEL